MVTMRKSLPLRATRLTSLVSYASAGIQEEVRRLEAQSARMDHAHNMEYLKNVLLQFLTHESAAASQREALVEVLSTMLKLTRKEREVLLQSTASPSATSPNGAARAAHELTGFLTRWTGK